MKHSLTTSCLSLLLIAACIPAVHAQTATWDGEGGDGFWNTNTNWDGDVAPVGGDTVNIGAGNTVTYDGGGNLPTAITLNLDGTLTNSGQGAIRMAGATIAIGSTATLTGDFWDLAGATLSFEDGASATMTNWEQKGTNVFDFELSASGFTTLTPGTFRIGGGATIANATYNVDMASYTGGAAVITLVDFTADAAAMDDATFQGAGGLNILNPPGGFLTSLRWNNTAESIELAVTVPVVWDGGGVDDSWGTPENWNPDGVPTAVDQVIVGAGANVTDGTNVFSSLGIEAGATVTIVDNLTGTNDLVIAGTLDKAGVLRLGGATLEISGSLGSSITFFDTNNGTISFTDGAAFDNSTMSFEHKGTNTFNYTLSSTGFSTLVAGFLFSGSGATWADVTYNIDISAYDLANGTSVTLADYSGGNLPGDFNADATVNIIAGGSGLSAKLVFDAATSTLNVAFPKTWDGGGIDDSWGTPENWDPDGVPTAVDYLIVGAGANVTDGTNVFSSLEIESGATVTLVDNLTAGNDLVIAGTLDKAGVLRLNGANLEVTGSLGPSITFLDTNGGTMSFVDGAAFDNSTMSFEHKGANTFNYTLSSTGFSTLVAGGLFSGSGATWADVTYNVDVSAYDTANGTTVTLADYTSSNLPGDFDTSATVNILAGGSDLSGRLTFDTATSSLILTLARFWDGSGDTTWTNPDSTSWSGNTYNDGDGVLFLGDGAGTVTISGPVEPDAIAVESANDYIFSGGAIGGTTGLTKSGPGTLTLASANTYTGVTTVSGGTLVVGDNAALGDTGGNTVVNGGSLRMEGGISLAEPLDITGGTDIAPALWSDGSNTVTGLISGPGRIQTETGTLTISGGISSATSIMVGDFVVDTTPITLTGSGVAFAGDSFDIGDPEHVAGKKIVLDPVTGTHDWDDALLFFSAIVELGADDIMPTDASVRFGWTTVPNSFARLDLKGFDQEVASIKTDDLSLGVGGEVEITGSGTLTVNQATNTEYQGRFTGGLSLVKAGSGTLTLNNLSGTPNSHTGGTTVNEGTLSLGDGTNGTDLPDGGVVSVASGATLELNYSGTDIIDQLFLNGVQVNAGTYDSSDLSGLITGTGSLTVITSPGPGVPNIIDIELDGSGNVILTLDGSEAGLTAQQSDDLTMGSFSDVASTPGANTLTIDAVNVDPNTDGKDFYRVRN